MASFLLDKLVMYATDRDVRQSTMENAAFFDDLAVGVLDACYSADQCHTHLLILRELPEFAGATCMDLSNISVNMPFIAHTACQTLLNDVWHGELRQNNRFSIWLCLLCPPLIPLVIEFHAKNPQKVITHMRQPTLQSEVDDETDLNDGIRPSPPIPTAFLPLPVKRIIEFYVSPRITFLSNVVRFNFLFILCTNNLV